MQAHLRRVDCRDRVEGQPLFYSLADVLHAFVLAGSGADDSMAV
jgi:hypothetical protein